MIFLILNTCYFSLFLKDRDSLSEYVASLASRGLMFNMMPSSSGSSWRPLHKPHHYECAKKVAIFITDCNVKGTFFFMFYYFHILFYMVIADF